MSTITQLQGSTPVTTVGAAAIINNNCNALNTDKIETSYLDTDTTLAANSDSKIATQKAVKAYVDSGGNANASETTRGIVQEATDAQVTAGTATGSTGAKLFVTPAKLATNIATKLKFKFGGTGADGALAITTGTTTIDLAGVQYKELNYSSVSITGDGKLAFSNPHANGTTIIIKCSGDMTLTSSAAPMIDATNCGATGGNGGTRSSAGTSNGSNGSVGYSYGYVVSNFGNGAPWNGVGNGGATGTFGYNTGITTTKMIFSKYPRVYTGAGGGGGGVNFDVGSGSLTGGAGGKGGGVLIIECAGTLNFTTTGGVSASGSIGGDGVKVGTANGSCGGGGGGAGGVCILLYNIAGTVTGTVLADGGVGGNTGTGAYSTSYGGGGGGSGIAAGDNGTGSGTLGAKVGGNGAAGFALLSLNTEFA